MPNRNKFLAAGMVILSLGFFSCKGGKGVVKQAPYETRINRRVLEEEYEKMRQKMEQEQNPGNIRDLKDKMEKIERLLGK
jgi:hypothetical protein